MTAGPTGFESAACFYLNKTVVAWRHFAVFGSLISMPLFMTSCALRARAAWTCSDVRDV